MDETHLRTVTLTATLLVVITTSLALPVGASTSVAGDRDRTEVEPTSETNGIFDAQADLTLDSSPSISVVATATVRDGHNAIASNTADERRFLLRTEQQPQLAALIGIIALAVLGGMLAVRNRLEERTSIQRDQQSTSNEDFMTDRERVRELVTENGGRMKQADIVDSVEWSKAKVSRLLADLESEDEITKLRLGRENLICLRGQEPPASQSPDGTGSE